MNARVRKLNPHANTPVAVKMNELNPAANRQIHSEYFNHCLTKQIEILPLYLLKGTVQSVQYYLTTAKLQTIKKEYS
jgi:hypothetical protein